MKVPEAVYYQFMIMDGAFSSVAQLDNALIKFFNEKGLEVYQGNVVRGQADRPILWICPKEEVKLPKAPQGVPVKMKK